MEPEMTPEERDARTVFCMQLSARIRPRDLEEFFSSVGKVWYKPVSSVFCNLKFKWSLHFIRTKVVSKHLYQVYDPALC